VTGHSTTAVVNARIFTAAGLTEPRTVLIRGRHIVESGTPTTQFDAEGNTLLPGLIDAHLHAFRGAADLEDLTDCGITTGLDMGLWPVENISALRSAHGVTDIRSATIPAVGPERSGEHRRQPVTRSASRRAGAVADKDRANKQPPTSGRSQSIAIAPSTCTTPRVLARVRAGRSFRRDG